MYVGVYVCVRMMYVMYNVNVFMLGLSVYLGAVCVLGGCLVYLGLYVLGVFCVLGGCLCVFEDVCVFGGFCIWGLSVGFFWGGAVCIWGLSVLLFFEGGLSVHVCFPDRLLVETQ